MAGCRDTHPLGPELLATAAQPESSASCRCPPALPGTPNVPSLIAKVNPAVVNITATHEIREPGTNWPFEFFFGPSRPGRQGGERILRERALGTGVIVDTSGHVATNAHVIDQANEVRIKLADGRDFAAKIVGVDPVVDIAVLGIQGAKDLPAAALGSSAALSVGEYVVAIGNPFGLGNTVTMGIVSAKGREIGAGPYDDFIQTDASINPGNSGGPLFNLSGEVVGINTAISSSGKGIGFAIPIDVVKDELPQLISTGHATHAFLGVVVQPMTDAMAKVVGLKEPKGALIADVEADSPAAKAGVQPGDVILNIDNQDVSSSTELPRMIAFRKPGTQVALKVLHDKSEKTVEVTLGEVKEVRNPGRAGSGGGPSSGQQAGLGVQIADTPQGVVVAGVAPGGPAEGELRTGDILLEVNRTPIHRASDVVAAAQKVPQGQPILFRIRRGDTILFVAIQRQPR